MAEFLFHPEAREEYYAARAWYRDRSERSALRFEAEVERTLERIGETPEAYPHYDDEHQFALVRRFPFSIVYQLQAGDIYIVAIAHGSRSPGYWQDRS